MGNHLHLLVSGNDTQKIQNFLKTFAALLARKITGAHRGHRFGKFWDGLVFTRVLHSSFELLGIDRYFKGNQIERNLGRLERENYLKKFNLFLKSLKKVKAKNKQESLDCLSME